MSEIINISNFDFYLNFISDGFGLKQIDEPIGIDAINLVTESDEGRYARDIFFGGDDKVKITFTSVKNNYGFYFDKLVEYDKRTGFESEVEFIIKNRVSDVNYVLGELEFQEKTTDHYTHFDCNIIQVKNQALLKRQEDFKVDVFSDEDINGNEITPAQYYNLLIPAKPEVLQSEWFAPRIPFLRESFFAVQDWYFNGLSGNTKYEINNTLSFIPDALDDGSAFKFIDAIADLTEVKIIGSDISFTITGENSVNLYYRIGVNYATGDETLIGTYTSSTTGIIKEYSDISYEIDTVIPEGNKLFMYFKTGNLPFCGVEFLSGDQSITVTSTSVDTVTKAVRLIDATSQVAKNINQDFTVDAPRLDTQGEHYNQFIFSGDMLRGRDGKFLIEWKNLSEYFLSEPNMDYQVVDDTVFIGKEDDFYPNVEVGVFEQYPDENFNIGNNKRFTINEVTYKFDKYNQDKDDENTLDAVHTDSQLITANKRVQDKLDIEVPFIRDPFMIGTTQFKAITVKSNSLEQDGEIFIGDCITIAPSQTRSTNRRLVHNVNTDGNLQLLGEELNWSILGFVLGDIFTINTTGNSGDYTVLEIDDNIVTLEPISTIPTSIGSKITQVTYPLTGVQYVLRTNEGFDQIEGVLSPDQYANLRYTIKRSILENRGSTLKTITSFAPEDINVTFLKNEVDLTTQFDGGAVINELDPITQEELPDAILTPRYITIKVLCTFEQYQEFQTLLKTIKETDSYIKTIGGFVRIWNNQGKVLKGYPKVSDFTWADGLLTFELEEKFESYITDIGYDGSMFTVNEVGYPYETSSLIDYAVTNTNYVQFYDPNTRPLTEVMKYDLVSVNGVVFDTITELIQAIEAL